MTHTIQKPLFKQYLEIRDIVLPDSMYSELSGGYPSVKIKRNDKDFVVFKVDSNKKIGELQKFFSETEYTFEIMKVRTVKRLLPIIISFTKNGTKFTIKYPLTWAGTGHLISIKGETEEEMYELTKLVQKELTAKGVKFEKKCRWVCFT